MSSYSSLYKMAKEYRKVFTPGSRVVLTEDLKDKYTPIPAGSRGTVKHVDDMSQIHVSWDIGSSLALVPSEDKFRKLTDLEVKVECGAKPIKFYIGEENASGMEFNSKEEFLNALSESIDEAAVRGQKWFTVTIENESEAVNEGEDDVSVSNDAVLYYVSHISNHRCNRCNKPVLLSDNKEYTYQCMNCNEDLYEIETYKKENDYITSDELEELCLSIDRMLGEEKNESV